MIRFAQTCAFCRALLIACVVAAGANLFLSEAARAQTQAPAFAPNTDRLIIRFKTDAQGQPVRAGIDEALITQLNALAGKPLVFLRSTGGKGEHVLRLERRLGSVEIEAIAQKLRAYPDIEAVVADRIALPQLTPNDPRFSDQWNLAAGTGINALAAWDLTTGSNTVTVAVLDTGVLAHADLAGRILPGYDFVSISGRANDGDGRDANASDPGDWVTSGEASPGGLFEGCPVTNSHWHGTSIAGVIAAEGNNAQGIAGINWLAKILPVRVIGKCGGYTSDIVDGIRWAAGIPVPGVPDNANPARIVNLSMATTGACDVTWQSAINEVRARNVVVVAAAGNNTQNTANYSPASCANVITVAAVDKYGGLAAYSNTGQSVSLSAPGGVGIGADGIVSTSDNGPQTPASDSAYLSSQGTSLAAAHVSGVASLILSLKPALTGEQVENLLKSTARAFTSNAMAQGSFANCASSACGAGIVDANGAVLNAAPFVGTVPRLTIGGGSQGMVLRSDGTVWVWGTGAGPSPPAQIAGIGSVVGIASSGHKLMLRSDGTVWAMGDNSAGQLGNGTTNYGSNPLGLVSGLTGVTAIAAGGHHSLALKSDGTVWGWGENAGGVLGDGTMTTRLTPVQVSGLTGVVAIATGDVSSFAVKSDGTVWAWGTNVTGQLGDGTVEPRLTPVQVPGLVGVSTIAVGFNYSLAHKSDGTVWAWGDNGSGQLGDGTRTNRMTPVQVSGLTGVTAIAAGSRHSLALKADGSVWAWGSNTNGQLADGTFDTSASNPRLVAAQVSVISGVSAIAAGLDSVLVLKPDGSLYAWGANFMGLLGDGTTTARNTSVQVIGQGGQGLFYVENAPRESLNKCPELLSEMCIDTRRGER